MSRADSPIRDRMIFVLGAPRSGTHWLQRIIVAHPEVAAVPSETFLFSDRGLGTLLDRFHHGALDSPQVGRVFVEREALLDSVRDLCDQVFLPHLRGGRRYLVERTPLFGDYVSQMVDVYPDARVAHVVRDGRDVARSLVAQGWGPDSIEEAARTWRDAVIAGRSGSRLRCYVEASYERLLSAPRESIAALYRGLGLEPSEEAVEMGVAEAGQHLNVDRSAPRVGTEKWREAFSDDDLRAFDSVAGDLLSELGYERSTPGTTGERPGSVPRDRRSLRRSARGFAGRARRLSGGFHRNGGRKESVRLLNALLESIHTGRLERLPELLDPDVAVRITAGDARQEARGGAAHAALARTLRDDAAMRGDQVRGDVVPGMSSVTSVLTYQLEDGSRADRVVVLAARRRKVIRLSLYQLPPRPADSGS